MPTMKCSTLRSVATWLLLAGALVSAIMSGQQIASIAALYGMSYPESVSLDVPEFTRAVLPMIEHIAFALGMVAAAAGIGAAAACRFARDRTTREHVVTLISAMVYHLVFMAWGTFVVAFFVLPKLRAGI